MSPRRRVSPSLAVALIVLAVVACTAPSATPSGSAAPGSSAPASALPSESPTFQGELEVTVIQGSLSVPWDLAFAPDGTMVVTERNGTLRIYASGAPGAALLQTVVVPEVRNVGEAGLMGVAIDVDFANNPYLYVCASRDADGEEGPAPWHNQLLRYRVASDWALELDGPLFDTEIRANRQHNGCAVQMDATRHIWMSMGDALQGEDGWAQQPERLNGKILRINADGSIPTDNPVWPGANGPSYVYTIGHRNPQGIAFRPGTDEVYVSEHGTDIDDEVNLLVGGGNFGWPCYTDTDHPAIMPAGCGAPEDYLPPVWVSGDPTLATSGSVFLTGAQWGDWEGSLIVACLKEMDLRRLVIGSDGTLQQADILLNEQYGRLRAAVIGPDGALYVTTSNLMNASRAGLTPPPETNADVILRIAPR